MTALLAGSLADRIHGTLSEAARALRDLEVSAVQQPHYAGGALGLAIVHRHLDPIFPNQGHEDRTIALIDRAFELLDRAPVWPWLISGVAGIGLTLQVLGAVGDDDDPNESLDGDLLEAANAREPILSEWMHGVSGLVAYASARAPRPAAAKLVRAVGQRLVRDAHRDATGARYLRRVTFPGSPPPPYVDYGLAHGLPGEIMSLAFIVTHAHESDAATEARALLRDAVKHLLGTRLPPGARCQFPADSYHPGPARLGYCYGDATIAWALWSAATALEDEELRTTALTLAERAARLPFDESGVNDGGLCHGAAGLGYVFKRLHQRMRSEACRDAAVRWFEHSLSYRADVPELFVIDPYVRERERWNLLGGLGGIAMCFAEGLDLVREPEASRPRWDVHLLGPESS